MGAGSVTNDRFAVPATGRRQRGGFAQRWSRRGAFVVGLALLAGLAPLGQAGANDPPTLTTNKTQYIHGEVVHITGSGFDPGTHALPVMRPDGSIVVRDPSTGGSKAGWDSVFADDNGNFSYDYQLDTLDGDYEARAYPGTWSGDWSESPVATVNFSDPSTSANLDQCANQNGPGNPPTPSPCDSSDPTDWVNGNLGASKARYVEGASIPYRVVFGGMDILDSNNQPAPHSVTIKWDTTKSGKHAIDYLTSFNRTVTTADPCAGVSGCGAFTEPIDNIPQDLQVTDPSKCGASVSQIAGKFRLYGGTITSVDAYTYPDNDTNPYPSTTCFDGDKSASVKIHFTTTTQTPVLAWGGHIATRQDWPGASAVNIPGSPYHTALLGFDDLPGQHAQDASLSTEAAIFPATIIIRKDADPNSPQSFHYTTTNLVPPLTDPGDFSLVDDGVSTTTNHKDITNIQTFGTKVITEDLVTNWAVSFPNPCTITATDPAHPSTAPTSVVNHNVTIDLKEGDTVDCTFVNSLQTGTLIVQKQVIDDNGGTKHATDFQFQIDGGTATTFTQDGADINKGKNSITVTAGTYSVTEANTPIPGYATSYTNTANANSNCTNLTVPAGGSVTCTVTNDDNAATLHVIKHVINDNGGTALASAFTLDSGGTNDSPDNFAGAESPGTTVTLDAGSYAVSETGPSGYTTTFSGDCSATGTGTIANGGEQTCTVTNDDIPPNTGKIAPTATTCQDYRDQTAADLNELFYGVKGTPPKVNSVSPGVLFYYTTVTAPSASFDVTIAQTDNSATFPAFDVHHGQAVLYNGTTCAKLGLGTDGGSPTIHVSGATVGQVFIVGVKYDPTTVKGTNATGFPTVRYTFTTQVGGVPNGSSDFIDLKPKFP
jgi:hypothetical protein